MKIVIEKLKKKDLKDAILVYDENHNSITNYDKLYKVYTEIYENPLYHNFVAKADDKIVGLATIILNYDIVDDLKPFLTVWNFGIKETYRRKKIGTKMFQYILEFAEKYECSFISLLAEKENIGAQLFYEKMGFSKEVGYVKFLN